MRCRVADALEAGDFRHVIEQRRQIGDFAHLRNRATHHAAVGVDVLAKERDFAHALVGQVCDFRQHVVERPRHLLAPRVRHDAERAILAAAFHDRHERARPFHPRRRQVVEFFDFGKADVDLRPSLAPRRDHLRQAVQRLRTEDVST
jgi:hypothetical protein